MNRRLVRRITVGAVVTTVAALTVSAGTLVAMSKTVTITVDGEVTQVATMAADVNGALAAAGIAVAEHDTLAPGPGQQISDGSSIVLNRGRQVTFELDGARQQLWTTATTVDAALEELGRDSDRLELSAARSRSIGLEGLTLSAETLHIVTLVDNAVVQDDSSSDDSSSDDVDETVDPETSGPSAPVGRSATATTVETVAEYLQERGVTLGADDVIDPDLDTAITDGIVVTIDRFSHRETTETTELPQPPDQRVEDDELSLGIEEVRQQGNVGTEKITYRVTTVNGTDTETVEIDREVLVEPLPTVIHVGTKEKITMVGNRVLFNDFEFGINWDGLAFCESTNNPRAVDPTGSWYGMFQFDFPTWASVGGSGNPADASPTEQLMRAKLLYQSRGLQPWLCAHAAY